MRDGRTHPERRRARWAAALLLLLLIWALGACAADNTAVPGRSGGQATPALAPVPAHQSTLSPAASTATPTYRATVTPVRTPAVAQTPTKTRRAPATLTIALSGLLTIPYDKLPVQARETIELIQQGGRFPYRQDGAVFQNRERLLPARPNGYYHEYTVKTPGSPDRGARRIIAGDKGELYYTDDHYDSFRQVVMP
jgi:ribonuclease T1